MTDKLPPNLLALFVPRPTLKFLPPVDHDIHQTSNIDGVAGYLDELKEWSKRDNLDLEETGLQKRERLKQEKKQEHDRKIADGIRNFNPANDPNIRGNAYNTVFVSRLDYSVTQRDLEKEFGRFGPIQRV